MLPGISPPRRGHSRNWTEAEDQLLLDGIARYNAENPLTQFPQDPFSERSKTYYLKIKHFIPELDRSSKQIRQRYINNLSPKVLTKIADEDKERILALQAKYGNVWSRISEVMYRDLFKEKNYYGDNTVKDFYYANLRRESSNKKRKSLDFTDQSVDSITPVAPSKKNKVPRKPNMLLNQTKLLPTPTLSPPENNTSAESSNQAQLPQYLLKFSDEEVAYIQRALLSK